jgi:diadenosine tetraphosphate (Ap4A) HIT family hydrolase
MNVECLGNQMPHLHWQIIPRYKTDPRWTGPIWTTTIEELHESTLSESDRQSLMSSIREALQ